MITEYGATSKIPTEGDQAASPDQDPLINLKRLADAIAEGVVDSIQTDAELAGTTDLATPAIPHLHTLSSLGRVV